MKPIEDTKTMARETPYVCVWDTRSAELVARINLDPGDRQARWRRSIRDMMCRGMSETP